jgi:CO/xanthine dehydrogenase FAD-binding subunit
VIAYVPGYVLRAPRDLGETLDLLARDPDAWKPMAGGTDLMVLFNAGTLSHRKLLSLYHLSELKGVIVTPDTVVLGAATTFTEIETDTMLRQEFPGLCEAARLTGGLAIQNRGTLGGNLVNASPAADSLPALMVYDAELELVSAKGARWVSCEAFYRGYRRVALDPGELL